MKSTKNTSVSVPFTLSLTYNDQHEWPLFCGENKSSTYVSQRNVHKNITDLILFI